VGGTILDMGSIAPAKYTDAQRTAAAHAVVDRGLGPAAVSRLAAAGELKWNDARLEPFVMPPGSVGTYAKRLRYEREARDTGEVAQLPPRDAVEVLRKRLVQIADRETRKMTRAPAGKVDPERLRQTARAVREIAALPGPTDPQPPAPGAKVDGIQHGGQTKGGLVGDLLRDHRATHGRGQARDNDAQAKPAPTPTPTPREDGDHHNTENSNSEATTLEPQTERHDDGSPGAAVRALAVRVAAGVDGRSVPADVASGVADGV
jgi:hypothetical protein